MEQHIHTLRNNHILSIREATADDAQALLEYVESTSGESDFLTFGPGELELTVTEEAEFLRTCHTSDNQVFLLGLIEDTIVASLHFAGGRRTRIQHTGEFGMSVRSANWGCGIGACMLDALITWARRSQSIRKIKLRVRTDNIRAIRLYTRKGFQVEGTLHQEIFLNGMYFDHYWMGLILE